MVQIAVVVYSESLDLHGLFFFLSQPRFTNFLDSDPLRMMNCRQFLLAFILIENGGHQDTNMPKYLHIGLEEKAFYHLVYKLVSYTH